VMVWARVTIAGVDVVLALLLRPVAIVAVRHIWSCLVSSPQRCLGVDLQRGDELAALS